MTENESKYGKVAIVGGGRNAGKIIQAQVELLARIDELEAYQAIGTVEEFKALKEKNEPKKEIVRTVEDSFELFTCDKNGNVHVCPNCNNYLIAEMKFCMDCGQALKPKET